MQRERPRSKYPQRIVRIVLKTVLFLLLFILLVFILLLTPPVQRVLTTKVQHYLENKLHTRVLIGRISFGLSGKVGLQNVYIEDKTKDTLLSGGSIKGHLNFMRLFSNEVLIKDLEFQNITAKIKRVLPDTVYNFQFIVNAFTSENAKKPDTAQSPPMKLSINDIDLENVNISYTDVISGSDMFAHIGEFTASIDTLDPYTQHFVIPSFILRNSSARMKQIKPLVEPKPLEEHIAEAVTPSTINLKFGTIDLSKVSIEYGNDVSAFYTRANIGELKTDERFLDLANNKIELDQFVLNRSKFAVRFGKKQQARVVKQEVKKEVEAQKQAGWNVRISKLSANGNTIVFDDDNKPAQAHGLDYSHLYATDLTLQANDFIMNPDSIAVNIKKGAVREKSGLELNQLYGDVLYANNQSYVRNLYIKTPGSEIKRAVILNYPSFDVLTKHPDQSSLQIQLVQSHIQVRDILLFLPAQFRSNPALRNPNDIWRVNIIGNGSMNQFNFETLQFAGLSNTQIDAHGSLTGLADPKKMGGDFIIDRFHTNQNDIALLSGQRLSTPQINLPEDFTINGTINGNSGLLNAKLNISTSDGFIALNGRFSNFTNPAATTYNGVIATNNLRLGKILRQQNTIGSMSAKLSVNGKGLTPDAINTKFSGNIASVGYNKYQYRNIKLSGSLQKTNFDVKADINDPNADADFTASGNFSEHPAFKINGMIDSVKTLPLHLTTEPLVLRGKIDATASNIPADNIDANILFTQALFVSADNRLALDTIQLLSGRTDTGNYIKLKSAIANANITGQYRLADIGNIIQNIIQPYFTVEPAAKLATTKPYNFNFTADVMYHAILSVFIPGLTDMQTIHAAGDFSTDRGMKAELTTPYIIYQGNIISNLNVAASTNENGLQIKTNVAHLKSGNSFDVYNVRINATALHNNIDFSLGIDDQNARNKYFMAGLLTQPSTGTYSLKLKPDSLLLNYQKWTVTPDNVITFSSNNISVSDFILQSGDQRLSINSAAGQAQQMQINFSNFRLATITGFIKADSVLADGLINGNVTLYNILQEPGFTSDLTINDLTLRNDTLGNVNLRATTAGINRYNIDATITGKGNDVALTGWFATVGKDIDLNLDLNVRAVQLHTMEGAMGSAIKNASGAINGNVSIRGTVNNPSVEGSLNFDKASFALTPLGSQYYLDNQKLSVTNDGLSFNNFTIKDSAANALTLNGNVLTSNFINYEFNLKLTASNFLLLSSTKKDNPIYYGRMNITSDLSITGTEVKPVVDGKVTVNEGTALTFVVPQSEPGIATREGIVEFVDMSNPASDTLFKQYDSLNTTSVLGMDVALNIEVKKEAIFNIIVDAANGDFINAQGEALLTAGIDPSGKLTLTGNYTLESGAYQLSFNFIQRRFEINKGSTITWTGEPTSAQLDVTAVYIANTAPIDLVQNQIASSSAAIKNTYMQKLPFEVHLNLTGELMKPVVAFDILLPENKNYGVANDIVTTVQYKLQQLRQDQGETNKQVFSLLLLNRFVGENPFASSGGGFNVGSYARQSASKLLTEQLNQLAAGLINGVDVNFDIASTEDYTTGSMRNRTDLNIGLSKRLLNERLKISVGNNFELEGPQKSNNQQSNNIAGNVAVDYQLSRDGRYLIRFFRKNDYEGVVDGYVIENGFSFIISVDYNHFREILFRKKQKVTSSGNNQNPQGQ